MNLVIVESPTKAGTISKFLGKDFVVESSFGHVRDLPEKELGIDIEENFKPKYIIIPKAKKRIKELKEKAQEADTIILATDEDREGEAIAFHLCQALNLKNPKRIVFHEITKRAIEKALKNPRDIDMNLVDAQQARRILDRLVGYKLSPFLWEKIARGLSAGRVQSVAVRLVVERQREIEKFKPEEYWTVEAKLRPQITTGKIQKATDFTAKLNKKDGKTIPKLGIKTKKQADKIIRDLKNANYKVINIQKKEVKKNPPPPFTTSTLQQEASYKLGFSAKKTMFVAQQLYEKGYITYHRTDSLNLSDEFLEQIKNFVEPEYLEIKKYKSKKSAQEAHEAIRPTRISRKIDDKLYNLIWQRAVASQMKPATLDSTSVDIKANEYLFRATGTTIKFDGFLKIYPIKISENPLPLLKKNEVLKLIKLIPEQHFTKPPAPYTEASLVKALEEYGIGRPSTYVPILSTIQERNYIIKQKKRLYPTEIGILVNDILVKHFPEIVNIKFTANMEKDLDKIAQGKKKWAPIIKEFYKSFAQNLKNKYQQVEKLSKPTEKKCPKCGHSLIVRISRYGKFLGCSNYPKCKHIEKYDH